MSLSTTIFHLCVPIRTDSICEISRSDAINITVLLQKLYMRGEIPHLYVMFSTEARETKFKSVKFNRYTKILKECFKIWASGGIGGVTAKITPLCRDNLLSDVPPMIEGVVFDLAMH